MMVTLLPVFVCSWVEMLYLELGRYLINSEILEDKRQHAEDRGREGRSV